MDVVLASFLLVVPLLLLVLGILENRALLVLFGSIGLFGVGVYMLASPIQTYYIDAMNITKTVTNTSANEFVQYVYASRAIDGNINMAFSFLSIFLALVGLYNIGLQIQQGKVED